MYRGPMRQPWICSGAGKYSANIIWRCRSACSGTGGGGGATVFDFGKARDMPRLSAIVIARNEAKNIAACLDSLVFCDEWIVVDGGSEDATAKLAEGMGARVTVASEWRGFGPQKNLALSLASGDWVLSV